MESQAFAVDSPNPFTFNRTVLTSLAFARPKINCSGFQAESLNEFFELCGVHLPIGEVEMNLDWVRPEALHTQAPARQCTSNGSTKSNPKP